MTVLAILILLVSSVISRIASSWHQVSSKVTEFREARRAFDRLLNSVSQATLNPYLIYKYPNTANPFVPPSKSFKDQPSGYLRYSELQFVCGSSAGTSPQMTGLDSSVSPGHAIFFQAPLGTTNTLRLPTALNGCGFFVQYGGDAAIRPDFMQTLNKTETFRYRLYEYRSSTEQNRIYDQTLGTVGADTWYSDYAKQSRPIANNIVLMVISPQTARADNSVSTLIAPNYSYNSKPATAVPSGTSTQAVTDYQLPPMVAVTFVAIDEATAQKIVYVKSGAVPSAPPLARIITQDLFTEANKYDEDLNKLSQSLVASKINFRIFTATVPLRASKWGQGT